MKTRLTLKPGQRGTKQLTDKYGDTLLCIRFRYDEKNGKRLKTVELIVEQTEWCPPPLRYDPDMLVPLRIEASNISLRTKVKAAGGKWFPEKLLWFVKYGAIAGSALEKHIHVDNSENKVNCKKHLHIDDIHASTYR